MVASGLSLRLATSANDWPDAEPYIRAACIKGPGDMDPLDLRDRCASGHCQLWLAYEGETLIAAAVTSMFRQHDGSLTLEWSAAGGGAHVWRKYMAEIEAWAIERGCSRARSFSRPGVRRLMPEGYRTRGIIFEKAL